MTKPRTVHVTVREYMLHYRTDTYLSREGKTAVLYTGKLGSEEYHGSGQDEQSTL
jgi:hypothetical protein